MSNAIDLELKLKEYFGYNTFRSLQKDIITKLLEGNDLLAILPTGAGKSLCYQLPAMLLPGTALIISPLISLMQDQVASLTKNGIPAAYLNSSLSFHEMLSLINNLSDYKLLYVAPERFTDQNFLQRLKETAISFFVIDEAHCISQWGHSFRPEYRQLSILKQTFLNRPIIALTATATNDVEQDIIIQLSMQKPIVFKSSFDRPNLTIRADRKTNVQKQIKNFLEKHQNQSGIIYAATRKTVELTYLELKKAGYNVGKYHAGMKDNERWESQHAFIHDKIPLMVATVAFGMGIHKPDVRFIVHIDMPRTIEQYYQEIGRAGRDGLPSECLMFYGYQDLFIYKAFLDDAKDEHWRKQMDDKTERMFKFCNSLSCRRKELLRYFGESYKFPSCQGCDNCLDDVETIDGTIAAQKILSCVYRLEHKFGIRHVIEVLRGSQNQSVLSRGHNNLSTYGILSQCSEAEIRHYIDSLIMQGYLNVTMSEYPVLQWTESSSSVTRGNQKVNFVKKIFKEQKVSHPNYDTRLFDCLKKLRMEISQQERLPPFAIFNDRSLAEFATVYPQTQDDFMQINGVGPLKWQKYGRQFLSLIQEYCIENQIVLKPKRNVIEASSPKPQRPASSEVTLSLFRQGHSIQDIAAIRKLAQSTLIEHLVESIERGEHVEISRLVTQAHQEAIRSAADEIGYAKLTPIKEKLGEEFPYDEIKLVVAACKIGSR